MADLRERREREISVFSVWKNNVILKNIFLINAPPPPPPPLDEIKPHQQDQEIENSKTHQEFEEILTVGRHPDCDIRLEHPSISRFHLRIHSIPSSNSLFLTDLSSVHGTWISGKRIEPNVRTRLDEVDTLKIGGSSRVYKLHWIPFSQAYDLEQPFVPPLDFPVLQEDEEEDMEDENLELVVDGIVTGGLPLQQENEDLEDLRSLFGDVNPEQKEIKKVAFQNENSQVLKNEDSNTESLFQDENSEVHVLKEIQIQHEVSQVEDSDSESLFQDENSEVHVLKEIQMQHEVLVIEDSESDSLFHDENSEVHEQKYDSQVLVNEDSDSESLFQDENSEVHVQKEIQMQHVVLVIEDSESDSLFHDENSEAHEQKHDSQVLVNEDSDSESLFQDENSELFVQKDIPLRKANSKTIENGFKTSFEDQKSEVCMQNEILENDGQAADSASYGLEPLLMGENWEWVGEKNSLAPGKEYYPPPFKHEDEGFISSVLDGLDDSLLDETSKLLGHGYIPSAPPMPEGMTFHLAPKLDHTLAGSDVLTAETNLVDDEWNFWYGSLVETLSPPVEEHLSDAENQILDELEPKALSEECKDEKLWSFWSGNMGVESMCSSLSDDTEAFSESESRPLNNGYKSPQPPSSGKKQFGSPLLTLEHNSMPNIWSRRGKQECVPQILTTSSRTKGKKIETDQANVQDDPISRILFHGNDNQEVEEIFTPDKENFTPNTHRSMRKMAVLKEPQHSISGKSSIQKMNRSMSPVSDKENYSPNVLQEQKTARRASVNRVQVLKETKRERVPFQPLLAESPQKSTSEICILDAAIKSCTKPTTKTRLQDTCTAERTRKWNMVVDTTTLLNKESRKALQLLAGLKGTQLFIPRIVRRELDILKRQVTFFRRNSEVISALGWIQDCMAETPWWIHVQSTIEEGLPVAPTPPALLPHSSFSFESRLELVSPAAEDHVLDYALGFRRTRNDGQLVLLSNDITLRIKAMAEGLTCEGAEEFRESLVNPFSERFLWEDSSPRGQTWSCSDDIVLKERFYPSSLKMTPKTMENVKGLKLILLHNSNYFERMAALQ